MIYFFKLSQYSNVIFKSENYSLQLKYLKGKAIFRPCVRKIKFTDSEQSNNGFILSSLSQILNADKRMGTN